MRGILTVIGMPAAFALLYFLWFAPHYHPPPPPDYRTTFSCQAVLASIAPVDGGGSIAPVCGATPYPSP